VVVHLPPLASLLINVPLDRVQSQKLLS
jgi:type I restriction enzyme, R subunit